MNKNLHGKFHEAKLLTKIYSREKKNIFLLEKTGKNE